MVLQAKEYETASGKIQLQFVELLGTGLNDSSFAYVFGLEQTEFEKVIQEKYGAIIQNCGSFTRFFWNDLKLARKFKNELNAKARKIKFKVEFE